MYKAEVQVVNDSKWYGNSLEFKFRFEAEDYAKDLFQRWTQSEDWRVVKVEDVKVNHLSQKQMSQLRSYG